MATVFAPPAGLAWHLDTRNVGWSRAGTVLSDDMTLSGS